MKYAKVKEAFALIGSRAFGSDWSHAPNGAVAAEYMCQVDFGNHNRFVDSNVEAPMTEDYFRGHWLSDYMVENIKSEVGEVEYSSIYWHIESEIQKGGEVFNNYGNHHNSAEMFALFGFIDNSLTPEEDYYQFHIELLEDDENYAIKEDHFWPYWPDWDTVTKHPALGYGDSFWLNGGTVLSVHPEMATIMRLVYLPSEYFDSFTISSIINGFEMDYINNVIDPLVEEGLHRACSQLLEEYDTDYDEDAEELEQVQRERNEIKARMKSGSGNMGMLRDELWKLDMNDQVLRYRMREKKYLMDCSYLKIWLGI